MYPGLQCLSGLRYTGGLTVLTKITFFILKRPISLFACAGSGIGRYCYLRHVWCIWKEARIKAKGRIIGTSGSTIPGAESCFSRKIKAVQSLFLYGYC